METKTKFKKGLGVLLSLLMMLTVLSAMPAAVFADDADAPVTVTYASGQTATWDGTNSLFITKDCTIDVNKSFTMERYIDISKEISVTINGNGNEISIPSVVYDNGGNEVNPIEVYNGPKVTVNDLKVAHTEKSLYPIITVQNFKNDINTYVELNNSSVIGNGAETALIDGTNSKLVSKNSTFARADVTYGIVIDNSYGGTVEMDGSSKVEAIVKGIDNTGSTLLISDGKYFAQYRDKTNESGFLFRNGRITVTGGNFKGTASNRGIILSNEADSDMTITGGTFSGAKRGITVYDGHVKIGGNVSFENNESDIVLGGGKTFELADDFANTATVSSEETAAPGAMIDITSNVPAVSVSKITAAYSDNYEVVVDPENGKFALYTKPSVVFEANGGTSGEVNESGKLSYSEAQSYTITKEAEPVRDEFVFLGWSTDENAAEAEYKTGDAITVSADTVLYAVWSKHTHNWSEEWTSDGTHHWHECLNENCPITDNSEKDGYEEHISSGEATEKNDEHCTVCGYVIKPALGHNWSTEWTYDEEEHYHICKECDAKNDVEKHTYGAWTVTKPATADSDGVKTRACTVCGYEQTAPVKYVPNEDGNDKDLGKINNTTDAETNACHGDVALTRAEIVEKFGLTNEEQAAVENGVDVNVFLVVKDITESVPADDKALAENIVSDNETVAMYLDVSLFKQVTGFAPTQVANTNGNVKITFNLPESLVNNDSNISRKFFIVRVHDGKAEKLACDYNAETGICSFETDKFSSYAIAYADTVIKTEPVKPASYPISISGNVTADRSSAVPGDVVNVSTSFGYDIIVRDTSGKIIAKITEKGSFTMSDSRIFITVVRNESLALMENGWRHSYVYAYDDDMNVIKVNSDVKRGVVVIDLGADNAGKEFSLYNGKKSTSKLVTTGVLDSNGRYVLNTADGKKYTLILK